MTNIRGLFVTFTPIWQGPICVDLQDMENGTSAYPEAI